MVSFGTSFSCRQDAHRISKYKYHVDKVSYCGTEFPVELKGIPKIEIMNDIRFNVFEAKSDIYSLYISKICDVKWNLLLVEANNNSHYVWIKMSMHYCLLK